MSDRLTLGTGTGEPVHVLLAEVQDRASLEEDLMDAAKNGTAVTVSGSGQGHRLGHHPHQSVQRIVVGGRRRPCAKSRTHLLTSLSRGQAARRYAA